MLTGLDLIDAEPCDEDLPHDDSPQRSDVSISDVRYASHCYDDSRIEDLME